MSNCLIAGCQNPEFAGGMCSVHYNRWRMTGTIKGGYKARAPLSERVWRHIDVRGPDECWPWTGVGRISGYGCIGRGGRGGEQILAHRAVWEVVHGPIPVGDGYHGTVVRHSCDNRLCCNPAHLVLGTQADNIEDMIVRGRQRSNGAKAWATRCERYGVPIASPCKVEGCDGTAHALGMCKKHYERQRETGSTDAVGPTHAPLSERLWRQVEKRGPNDHWPWLGKRCNHAGEGMIGLGGKFGRAVKAFEAAWSDVNGPVPEGFYAALTCGERGCCNPSHVELREGRCPRGRRPNAT
jgi:hypothetical protein